MPDAKKLDVKVKSLENKLKNMESKFSDKRLVQVLGKALETEKRHNLIGQVRLVCIIGFTIQCLIGVFQLFIYLAFTQPI